MFNEYEKNTRNFPAAYVKTIEAPIVKKPHLSIVKDDEWESVNSNASEEHLIYPQDPDDENDLGGLAGLTLKTQHAWEEISNSIIDDSTVNISEFKRDMAIENTLGLVWLVPGIIAAGPHPILMADQEDLSEFKKAGFKAIVTSFEKPLEARVRKGFEYYFTKTAQGFSSDLMSVCKFISGQEEIGNPVFVHSLNGLGRAATILAAYLVYMQYLTGKEAIGYVRQHYHRSAITNAQESAIFAFENLYSQKS